MPKKNHLQQVFDDTLDRGRKYRISQSTPITLQNIHMYPAKTGHNYNADIVLQDCIDVAYNLSDKYNVALLNMASIHVPGGGVLKGCTAQEEQLCRRSNLYHSLIHASNFYPLKEFSGLSTKNVTIFKDASNIVIDPRSVTVITVAAYQNPKGEYNYQGMINKIRLIVVGALEAGCDCLILSALGCGAYNNPPGKVAECFKYVLYTEGYVDYFSKVIIAIYNEENYRPFVDTMGT